MAAGTPLPRKGGVVQTDQILRAAFAERGWDEDRQDLVRYYFLVARMEKSRTFSEEFARRRSTTEKGRELMQSYLVDLNKAIARAVFVPEQPVDLGQAQDFPLAKAEWEGEGGQRRLRVLHDFPPVDTALGRETLRSIRAVAGSDLELLEVQLSDLDEAERQFTEEISLVGKELMGLRPKIGQLVRLPQAGLPFSF